MPHQPVHSQQPHRQYKYYDLVMVAFVTILLCANLIGVAKNIQFTLPGFGQVVVGAGVLFFPISYLFGDILTEVYGYGRDRRVIWAGFGALTFASFMSAVVIALPPASNAFSIEFQTHLEAVFGNTPRIALASMLAFWCGSFANSYVMARMKVATAGRWLWARTIGSTLVGEMVDSSLFYMIAFYGIWPTEQVISLAVTQYVLKTLWEVVATPLTYTVVNFLKRKEHEDFYDRHTNFNPFKIHI